MADQTTPAFPSEAYGGLGYTTGMTLRDYFAAKAMQATVQAWITTNAYPPSDLIVARNAYEIADAMLEAREA